ncbi:hypothetical protein [Niallia sp. FSL W8-0635]|uniref:hypothetical protein n=1 Tax=Niallia sp. FSL W8-0635 TaxID=2975337 RepID=UPI0009C98C6F|nr:Uncharacterised protein [Mycobacteroides abscessus subsp. abscessus]HEO8421179.1 hypothetical protein [Yersinia enterocolitica]
MTQEKTYELVIIQKVRVLIMRLIGWNEFDIQQDSCQPIFLLNVPDCTMKKDTVLFFNKVVDKKPYLGLRGSATSWLRITLSIRADNKRTNSA